MNRPELLRRALRSIVAQDYAGRLRVLIVYDRVDPDPALAEPLGARRVDVMRNARAAGLAGARNTGIIALNTELVAFCDDDDEWLPDKLSAQVSALCARPEAEFVSCGIEVEFGGRRSVRLAGGHLVTHADLLRSRMAMVHSSTFLIRRAALLDGIGLLDEQAPGGQNEDWDLLLRASARQPLVNVDRPLVRVLWGQTSHFSGQWQTKIDSLEWMLRRHPDIATSSVGLARVYGQLAFHHAALGHRRQAVELAVGTLRTHWREGRAVLALAVAAGLVSPQTVLRVLHGCGRGV